MGLFPFPTGEVCEDSDPAGDHFTGGTRGSEPQRAL